MAYVRKLMSSGLRPSACTFYLRGCSTAPTPLSYSDEVLRAKAEGKPIVALESTIITHGMPYPENLETAIQVENIIRQRGAIPATVAILKGQLTVGLTEEQLRYLAQAKGVVKASTRDLAPIVAEKLDGATTVAGTIVAAELADIPIFVTGGIGGVHRQGEQTMDVSADLNELGHSRTLVVCSGVKSILDIGRTLEYLETQGVCVCAFGKSNEFPAFYTVRSGHRAPHHVLNAKHAARVLHVAHKMHLSSGTLIAVPVPEEHAMDETIIEGAVTKALQKANMKGIRGKEVTPFILAAVAKTTGGASLAANIALIKNNAKVGADIAVEFNKLKNVDDLENAFNIGFSKGAGKCSPNTSRGFHTSCSTRASESVHDDGGDLPILDTHKPTDGDVLVIGGANVDRIYRVTEERVQLDGSTHMCITKQCGGGVGRNMAEALWRLRSGRTRLLTAVGDDVDGQYLANIAPGLLLDGCVVKGARTPSYAAVLDARGECRLGLGDMTLHSHITIDLVERHKKMLEKASLVVLDGNVPQPTVDHVLRMCHQLQKPVFFEPTDRRKAVKALQNKFQVTFASPNVAELRAMANFLQPNLKINDSIILNEIIELSKTVSEFVQLLIVTVGSKGIIIVRHVNLKNKMHLRARFYPIKVMEVIENVSGAGDCFACGFIYGILKGLNESCCVSIGFNIAKCALLSKNTVPANLRVTGDIKEAYYETLL